MDCLGANKELVHCPRCKGILARIEKWLAVSASIMRVQIGMLSGITDVHLLFAIFMLTATTMLFGWLMETSNGCRLSTYSDDGTALKVCCIPEDFPLVNDSVMHPMSVQC
jgi:hypothetical protein